MDENRDISLTWKEKLLKSFCVKKCLKKSKYMAIRIAICVRPLHSPYNRQGPFCGPKYWLGDQDSNNLESSLSNDAWIVTMYITHFIIVVLAKH